MKTPKVFICCSNQDKDWKNRVLTHLTVLERARIIEIWDESRIPGGSPVDREVSRMIETADIALLLVSPDFLASDFIMELQLPLLVERRRRGELILLPVLIRSSVWRDEPTLATLQVWPRSGQPLRALGDAEIDQILTSLIDELATFAGAIAQRETRPDSPTSQRDAGTESQGSAIPEFFVSHSRADGDFAELLKLRLDRDGYEAWVDVDRLMVGEDWRDKIDEALRQSTAVIVVMSPEARASEYVTYEWAFASGAGIRLIPLMLRQTPLHPRLATLQYLDFTNQYARPWAKLMKALDEARAVRAQFPQQVPPTAPATPEPAPRRRRRATGS